MHTADTFPINILLVAERQVSKPCQQKISNLFAEIGICVDFSEKRSNGYFDHVAVLVPCMYKHTTTRYYEKQYGKVFKILSQNPTRILSEFRTVIKC